MWKIQNRGCVGAKDKDTCLAVQDLCLRQVLLLLHPVTPFITEELWHVLGFSGGQSIQWVSPGSGEKTFRGN